MLEPYYVLFIAYTFLVDQIYGMISKFVLVENVNSILCHLLKLKVTFDDIVLMCTYLFSNKANVMILI